MAGLFDSLKDMAKDAASKGMEQLEKDAFSTIALVELYGVLRTLQRFTSLLPQGALFIFFIDNSKNFSAMIIINQ